jgi:2,3-bisphosphoglycerate-dependent phosphoglycerate mutase
MELYFIRHGQSINNAHWEDPTFQDVPDPWLTETGLAQARHLARFLGDNQSRDLSGRWNDQNEHGFGLTHLYTSLMIRAVKTATPVAQATGLPLVAWREIHETGGMFARGQDERYTGLPGESRAYYEQNYPHMVLPDSLTEAGWWNRPFEADDERKVRAAQVWAEIKARHGDQDSRPEHRVALVSHGGFFVNLFCAALGIDLRRLDDHMHEFWIKMNNCAITRLDIKNGQVVVAYTNRNHFIPPELVTS